LAAGAAEFLVLRKLRSAVVTKCHFEDLLIFYF